MQREATHSFTPTWHRPSKCFSREPEVVDGLLYGTLRIWDERAHTLHNDKDHLRINTGPDLWHENLAHQSNNMPTMDLRIHSRLWNSQGALFDRRLQGVMAHIGEVWQC